MSSPSLAVRIGCVVFDALLSLCETLGARRCGDVCDRALLWFEQKRFSQSLRS